MQITTEKLMQYAGELAILKIAYEEEIARLSAELDAEMKKNATPIEGVEFEKNGLALCTE